MKSVRAGAFGSLLKTGITKVYEFGSKHSHIISAGVGIVSIVATGYFAYKARPKMDAILDEAREKMDALNSKANDISEEEYKKEKRVIVVETVKKATPVLAPAVISGVTGSAANCFSAVQNARNIKKIAEVSAFASMNELAYSELYSKTKEIVGEEKMQEIKQQIDQDRIDAISEYGTMSISQSGFYDTGLGVDPWYDRFSGMLFYCSEKAIREKILECKEGLIDGEPYFVMNELYSKLHLPQTIAGGRFGFKITSMTNQRDLMKPNLNNAVRWGEGSISVLDWWDEPEIVSTSLSY